MFLKVKRSAHPFVPTSRCHEPPSVPSPVKIKAARMASESWEIGDALAGRANMLNYGCVINIQAVVLGQLQ